MTERGGVVLRGFIDEDHFEDEQVIVERNQAAKERQRDEPEQAVVFAGA
jgi:hypothetical protein